MAKVFTKDFPSVVDGKIKTKEFLEACGQIPGFFDLLGKAVFSPVKKDIVQNIGKMQKRLDEKPNESEYIEDIIINERKETCKDSKSPNGNGPATNALMWLKRGLRLIVLFLEHFLAEDYHDEREKLSYCVCKAYDNSLKQFHGWFVQKLVTTATGACPSRKNFLNSLCTNEGLEEDQMIERIQEFLVNFKANVNLIYEIYDKTGAEKQDKA